MEYYILKCYESKIKEVDIKLGFNRFTKAQKAIAIISIVVMIISSLSMIGLLLMYPKKLYFGFALIPVVLSVLCICVLDAVERKNRTLEHKKDEYIRKIDSLDTLLKKDFSIDSKEKIEILKNKYKQYIDDKKESEKRKNKIIVTLFSALSGILSISFSNLDKIDIGLEQWIYFAVFLLVFISSACGLIHLDNYLDSLKQKYNSMINDLEDLLLLKY